MYRLLGVCFFLFLVFSTNQLVFAEEKNMKSEHFIMGVPAAHDLGIIGRGVKVAILDTGVSDHPNLPKPIACVSFVDSSEDCVDRNGHGTHVAGILAAQGKDGVWGVAPGVSLYIGKVMDDEGAGNVDSVSEGIRWAVDQGVDLINLSLSFTVPKFKEEEAIEEFNKNLYPAIQYAKEHGVLIVAASGNESASYMVYDQQDDVTFPAKYEEVLSVAAIQLNELVAEFSSNGKEVDVSAPGVDIFSTSLDSDYHTESGTSMASPMVTGILALWKQSNPYLYIDQLKEQLIHSVVDLGDNGHDIQFGYGLVQAPASFHNQELVKNVEFVAIPGYRSVELTWKAESGVRYDLYLDHRKVNESFIDGDSYVLNLTDFNPHLVHLVAGVLNEEIVSGLTVSMVIPAPQNVKYTAYNESVRITWDPVVDATEYCIEMNGKWYSNTSSTKIIVSNLQNDVPHVFSISAKRNNLESSAFVLRDVAARLPSPLLKTIIPGDRQLTIHWDAVPNAIGYYVYLDGQKSSRLIPGIKHTVIGLKNATYYKVTVTAVSGQRKESNLSKLIRIAPRIGIPQNVRITSSGDQYVVIEWNAVTDATEYILHLNGERRDFGKITSNRYVLRGLENFKHYDIQIAAYNEDFGKEVGENSVSELSKKVIGIAGLIAPTVKKINKGSSGMLLSWGALKGVKSYLIYVDNRLVKTLSSTQLSYLWNQKGKVITVAAVYTVNGKSTEVKRVVN